MPVGARARGRLLAREHLIVCGLPLLERVFARLGEAEVALLAAEGQRVLLWPMCPVTSHGKVPAGGSKQPQSLLGPSAVSTQASGT